MGTGTPRFRVLDTLARSIGASHSIRSLADEVQSKHGTGHYPNVHEQLQRLEREGIVSFQEAGRSKVPRLHFDRTGFPDTMATLELWRKRTLVDQEPNLAETLNTLETTLASSEHVLSVSLAAPERNLKLRRLEPLVLARGAGSNGDDGNGRDAEVEIAEQVSRIEEHTALRADAWVLPAKRFQTWLTTRDANPAPGILRSQTCIWHPQAFWRTVAEGLPHGTGLAQALPTKLASLEEPELAWNLARWGYEERGREIEEGTPLCPEAVAIGALTSDIPRWLGAASVVLANADVDPPLVVYLAKAEGQAGVLAGIAKILHERDTDPSLEHILALLEALAVEPEPIEQDMVLDAVDLYGG